ncbi:MAG: hypothetical protein ACKOZT_09310 [Cyanobium sp.]
MALASEGQPMQQRGGAMSWSELERLVETAELDAAIRRGLRHCRSVRELLLAAGRLGFAIHLDDLRQARAIDQGGATASTAASATAGGRAGLAQPAADLRHPRQPAATFISPLAS